MPVTVERYLSSVLPLAVQRGAPWGFKETRVRAFAPEIQDAADVWEGASVAQPGLIYLEVSELLAIQSDSAQDALLGSGARRIRISGLDATYAEITEDVILAGVTAVFTIQAFLRVNDVQVLIAGAGGGVEGSVVIEGSGSALVQAVLTPESGNRSQQSHFTIPVNRTGYIVASRFSADISETRFDLQARQLGGAFISIAQFQTGQTPTEPPFHVPEGLPEMTDIKIVARRLQGPSAVVFAGYDLITAPKSLSGIRSFGQPQR